MNNEAAVDNDFFNNLLDTSVDKELKITDIIAALFAEMQVSPIMHELLYKHEFDPDNLMASDKKANAKALINRRIVEIKTLDSFLEDDGAKEYYKAAFRTIYEYFRTEGLAEDFDCLSDWKAHCSMGEIHTTVMCIMICCGIFLSDDLDSEKISKFVKKKYMFDIQVFKRKNAVARAQELGKGFNKHLRRALSRDIK